MSGDWGMEKKYGVLHFAAIISEPVQATHKITGGAVAQPC